jgi:Protein of unknown function (DUF3592)
MNEHTLLSLLCVAVALYVYYNRRRRFAREVRELRFPVVTGRILTSELREETHESEDDMGRKETSVTWHPVITYTYELDGKAYRNSRYAILSQPSFSSQEKAEAFRMQYKSGDEVTVHYDPTKPANAYLDEKMDERPIDGKTWLIIAFMLVMAVVFQF